MEPGAGDDSVLTIVGGIFTVVGIGLLLGGLLSYSNTRAFIAGASTARGAVTQLVRKEERDGITYTPVVEFRTPQGRVVEFTGGSSNPPAWSVGDAVDVLYDPQRPEQASLSGWFSLWGVAIILGGLGLAFALLGGLLLGLLLRGRARGAAKIRDREDRETLRDFGRKVDAKIREVREEPGGTYRIVAQWHDPADRKVYVFESESIGFDPGDFLQDSIPVYLDPSDPGRYLVDTSSLPTLGNAPETTT